MNVINIMLDNISAYDKWKINCLDQSRNGGEICKKEFHSVIKDK